MTSRRIHRGPRSAFGSRVRIRGDRGSSLVLVMMIAVLTFILIGTATSTLVNQIKPAKASQDDVKAMAAAQAGLEDFLGQVNSTCSSGSCNLAGATSSSVTDAALTTTPATQLLGANGSGNGQYFKWTVVAWSSSQARVKSTGQAAVGFASNGTPNKFRLKTIVADYSRSASFLDFEYYSTFETYSADYLNNLYTPRTIATTLPQNNGIYANTQIDDGNRKGPGKVVWSGVPTTTGPADATSTAICEDTYYNSSYGPGRGTNTAYNNSARRYYTGSDFAWYYENGTWTRSSDNSTLSVQHRGICDVAFEAQMVMAGPVYTQDAFLLDSPDSNQSCIHNNNQYPVFNSLGPNGRIDKAQTEWNGQINGSLATPNAYGHYFRNYLSYGDPNNRYGGVPSSTDSGDQGCQNFASAGSNTPLVLNSTIGSDPVTLASCTYYGPTRIRLVNNIAYITSPDTPSDNTNTCYTSTGQFANTNSNAGGGVVEAAVPVTLTLIYVKNEPAIANTNVALPSPATRANRVFDLSTNLAVPPNPTPGTTLTGTWTTAASYPSSVTCPLSTADTTQQRNFDCEVGKTANPKSNENVLGNVTNASNGVVQGNTVDASVQSALQTAINGQMSTTSQTAPTNWTASSYYYTTTVGALATTSSQTKPADENSVDPFFQSTPGDGYTTTVKSWPITIARVTCPANKIQNNGNCQQTSSQTIVQGNASRTNIVAAANVNSTAKFPWFGTPNSAGNIPYNDPNTDISKYYPTYGDAYVEGTLRGGMTLVADHDIVVTNQVQYANNNVLTTSDGAAYVAGHNIRLYRPLTCAADDPTISSTPTTTLGWCPNDLSSADSIPTPTFGSGGYTPANQYVAMNAPSIIGKAGTERSKTSPTMNIYGSFFTLGVLDPRGSGTRVGGSFMVDNVQRGNDNGDLLLTGGLYQYHRGVTKMQWMNHPGGSTIPRPGMTLTYSYDNLRDAAGHLRVPWVPLPSPTTVPGRTWNITAIATVS